MLGFLKAQAKLWLSDTYSAIRVLTIAFVLALVGVSGWASIDKGEVVNPIEVLVNPSIVLSPVIENVVQVTFPNISVCDDDGKCFTVVFD